jgi:hypothetical protein|tara:strand:+ start:255 stop:452 length:198 start_codon:yes stop_codon:yes gene_type:complete
MSNVFQFDQYKKEQEVESQFVELLEREASIDSNVKPLSNSLLTRMFALKKAGYEAKTKREHLLEG